MILLFFFILLPLSSLFVYQPAAAAEQKQYVYDFAGLLTDEEIGKLEDLSRELGAERKTDFIILTVNDLNGKDVVQYTEDFYDEKGLGYDKVHGNTAILTLDMMNREVYLAGFYKAEEYLDDQRLDLIREDITPDLSSGAYYSAFETFIKTSYEYMGIKPGVNPENILFKWWFQLTVAVVVAGAVVGLMAFNSGGRVTVNDRTYMSNNTSRVLEKRDTYLNTTVTKQKIPKQSNSGGGGGGITGGGHSHSGSRGGF
jgi:uncharacterized protein